MKIDYRVEGLDELEKKLLKLEAKTAKKTLQKAMVKAATPIQRTAKRKAPGSIKKAIFRRQKVKGVSSLSAKSAGSLVIGVFKSGPRGAPHAHLIEYGTKQRKTKKKPNGKKRRLLLKGKYVSVGENRGRVKPQSFMRYAWRTQGKKKYLDRFKTQLEKEIMSVTK